MRPRFPAYLALLILALAGCNRETPTTTPAETSSPSPDAEATPEGPDVEGDIFEIALTGAEEVPGSGDTDGSGTAKITIPSEGSQICYELTVADIEPASAAHIHSGAKGVAGPIFIELEAPTDGSSEACVEATEEQIKAIKDGPASFYVNVHNRDFPQGAVRGQLAG